MCNLVQQSALQLTLLRGVMKGINMMIRRHLVYVLKEGAVPFWTITSSYFFPDYHPPSTTPSRLQ
jgi:hypothetical protein